MSDYTNIFSHRQLLLTDPRTEVSSGDTISITASSDTITTNGLVLSPANIVFTATTTGIFANIPPANIVWKKNDTGDPLGTGTLIQILNSQYGIDALANAGSYSITATATLNPAADLPIFKKATKVITLSSNNISANISPATASYTTDAAGVGTASIVLTMNIVAGTSSVADNWTYAWLGATFAGNATTANTASVTVISISTDTATVQCIATKGIYTITKTAVISKSKTGSPGSQGKKTSTGYVYWTGVGTPNGPGYGIASVTYTFGSSTPFSTMSSGWGSTISFDASKSNYACYYSVEETTAGTNLGVVTFGTVSLHTSFDGLVTFTDLNNTNGGATLIHGSNIITGSVTLDSLKSSSSYTYGSNGTFTLGSGSTYYGYNTVGYYKSTSLAGIALGARSIGHVSFVSSTAIETDSSNIPAAGIFTTTWGDDLLASAVHSTTVLARPGNALFAQLRENPTALSALVNYPDIATRYWVKLCTDTSDNSNYGFLCAGTFVAPKNTSVRDGITYIPAAFLAGPGYAVYTNGLIGPFTGAHDALISTSTTAVQGDILVDVSVIARRGLSDVITLVALSSVPNDKAAVGIYSMEVPDLVPTAMSNILYDTVATDQGNVSGVPSMSMSVSLAPLLVSRKVINMNSIGEGQVNVCGEGGNLATGDLITTSSIAGKGMKQSDGIVRNYTVAKCRENVTFSLPTEVKMVACIYLCG